MNKQKLSKLKIFLIYLKINCIFNDDERKYTEKSIFKETPS